MTNPAPWIKYQGTHKVHIIGSFENVHGERYVIWRNENGDTPYFTGDEVDWKPERLWPSKFMFNEDERAQVAKLLWIAPGDLLSADGLRQVPVTYSPELEQRPEMIAWWKEHNVPALSWDAGHPEGS